MGTRSLQRQGSLGQHRFGILIDAESFCENLQIKLQLYLPENILQRPHKTLQPY